MSSEAPIVKELYFSYFIGRCNPPHQGHFHMINGAILAANEKGGKALILLGSGPKAKSGNKTDSRRTEKDPLTFDLKKEIIEKNITNCEDKVEEKDEEKDAGKNDGNSQVSTDDVVFQFEPNHEIVEMTNPTTQLIEFVETELQYQLSNNNEETLIKITVEHFCGKKELEDNNKMRFYQVIQEKLIENMMNVENNYYNNVAIKTEIKKGNVPNENGASMSATSIRDDVNKTDLGIDIFKEKYKNIYGDDAGTVYDAIKEGKRIGESILQKHTDSKTRKKRVCRSTGSRASACNTKPNNPNTGGKRKTNKRKQKKTSKKRKTNKRKRRKTKKTKRTNKRKK
jgi:hypothetical protein